MYDDLGDREDVPGRRELLQMLGQAAVEAAPPRALAADREAVGEPGERGVLRDQQGEAGAPDVGREAAQERFPAPVLLAGPRVGGLDVQVRQVLLEGLGLPAVQPAQT
ncbi:hypothetical protein ACIPPJ_14770 [Streptomyces sp. NPDC086091]|uniref:hypothetical protein n=1 Tax=Streptomyces sp. NPDC086091 TaxID=3365751 RepID=UPI0038051200